MPDEAEVCGTSSRCSCSLSRDGRLAIRQTGALVLLRDQDRSSWDSALIEEGHAIVRACLRRNPAPGPYQIQACHKTRCTPMRPPSQRTDWSQILTLYDQLLEMTPTAPWSP